MSARRLRSGLAAAALALAGMAPAAAADPSVFLWTLDGPQARHHLLGSIHVLPPEAHPLPAALTAALAQSRQLVLELDPATLETEGFAGQMLNAAYDGERSLEQRLGQTRAERLRSRLAGLDLPASLCDAVAAWFCALSVELSLVQRAGARPDLGVDHSLWRAARERGLPVRALETPAEQLAVFTGLGEDEAAAWLDASMSELGEDPQRALQLVAQWRAGDLVGLERSVQDLHRQSPVLHERLLAARNRRWVQRLEPVLQGATPSLIVVGAAHLVGPDHLRRLLRNAGWTLQPQAAVVPKPEALPAP